MPITPGQPVSDADTYRLARAAGWSPGDAVTATAISFAEAPSRMADVLSPTNRNGTQDLGLWQINSIHWPNFGGADLLSHAFNNASAAFAIFDASKQRTGNGWLPWATYTGGQYQFYLTRAVNAQALAGDMPGSFDPTIPDLPLLGGPTPPGTPRTPSEANPGAFDTSSLVNPAFGPSILHVGVQLVLVVIGLGVLLVGALMLKGNT